MSKSNLAAGLSLALAVALVSGLAGCGGGADPLVVEDNTGKVPASATASVRAFVSFVGGLMPADNANNADHATPLSVDGLVPPTSDADEPVTLS